MTDQRQDEFSASDRRFMARAFELAEKGLYTTDPNPRVGCVLVKDGEVIGEGFHVRTGGDHAEAAALMGVDAQGATAYVTLEPCAHQGRTPSCAKRLVQEQVAEVVAASSDPDLRTNGAGFEVLREAGIRVRSGLMAAEALALNPGFFARAQRGRPYVRLKLAMSLDGRTAMSGGESEWITGKTARQDVQHWRARSSAVLTGIGTVLADDPRMTARVEHPVQPPLLVVLDSSLRISASARLFDREGSVVLVTADTAAKREDLPETVEVLPLVGGSDHRLTSLLKELGKREINEVHIEAGPTLAGAFLRANLVDELLLYVAPCAMGHGARPLFVLPGLAKMADRLRFEWLDVARVGDDLRLRLMPKLDPKGN